MSFNFMEPVKDQKKKRLKNLVQLENDPVLDTVTSASGLL